MATVATLQAHSRSTMTAAAFLEAILHEPDDVGHRLVFADWLEDNGQAERAEFIRLQVERDTLHPADPRVRSCLRREAELLACHEEAWVGRLARLVRRWRFHRGFVEEISIGAEPFLAHGAELFRLAPIRRLQLRNTLSLPNLLAPPRLAKAFADLL